MIFLGQFIKIYSFPKSIYVQECYRIIMSYNNVLLHCFKKIFSTKYIVLEYLTRKNMQFDKNSILLMFF